MLKSKMKISVMLVSMLLLLSNVCFAATVSSEKAKLEIVENNICTIKINEVSSFEKKIIDSDLNKKEITMQMKITNDAEKPLAEPTEIFLVLDTSFSMKNEVATNVSRMEAMKSAANKLATELLKNETVKLGITTFSSNADSANFGTLLDANLEAPLTDSISTISSTIEAVTYTGNGQTNIDAGLTLASQNFSDTCKHKFIILLTDGVPNLSLGNNKFTYSGVTTTNTRKTLEKLTTEENIKLISVMTGVNPTQQNAETGMTYKELVEEIFGTPTEPSYGNFYFINDSEIEKTVTQDVLKDIVNTEEGVLTNIDIYDYFPQEIIDNFDFSYTASPTLGTISPKIDLENRYIIWHIDRLEQQTSGLITYKLTLKENIDSNILNKILNTNEKVEITANEIKTEDGSNVLSSTVSPKVRVTIPEEPKKDNTVANTIIPQTGSTSTSLIVTGIVVMSCLVIAIRIYFLNRKTK